MSLTELLGSIVRALDHARIPSRLDWTHLRRWAAELGVVDALDELEGKP